MTKLQQPDGKHMPNAGGAVSTTYRPKYVPATQDIRETFGDEIAAHALETRRFERTYSTEVFVSGYDLAVALTELRLAVRACAAKEAFEVVAGEMRTAAEVEADLALHLGPALASLPRSMTAQWLPMIFRSFEEGEDRSAFGLLNAVTAVARDISDPEVRWTLEQLGGTTPARLSRSPKAREVLVGA